MPYINIRITRGKEAVSSEQKAKIIKGVTKLVSTTLNRNIKTTFVIIDEIETDNWGIAGNQVT